MWVWWVLWKVLLMELPQILKLEQAGELKKKWKFSCSRIIFMFFVVLCCVFFVSLHPPAVFSPRFRFRIIVDFFSSNHQ